ncbi:vanadium-dependent haloperoxidase [Dokdonia sp. 4H-3-7-5]|uniref:vanadium-dependent haloperoxidase n=1 Tax=Dokdonia sp. (strain 4H-3-7-5) TaxID=983548 RepID=UPI00020A60AC|nr:vanadium-dependent haloperoxidase [Dokdonia sp. 4H-3-7-5]AEE18312.1 phosphoesterase PA-phosphatase related protein [Dokdonia sp. 4H-3-7-5]
MRISCINPLLLGLLVVFLFQSCQDDVDDVSLNQNVAVSDIIDTSIIVTDPTTQLITDWNTLWLEVDQYAYGMRPVATARSLAYIHLAAYEVAVADVDGNQSNVNNLDGLTIDFSERPDNVDIKVALNTCYALVFDHFMYNVQSDVDVKIDQHKNAQEIRLQEGLSADVITNSMDWGTYVAEQVILYSQTDAAAESQIIEPQPYAYEPPAGEGYWTYSADEERAWFPYWASARTFVISSEETSSIPPTINYSTSIDSDFYNEMMEVYTINNTAREEDNDDLWIAEFWSDDVEGLMISPPGRQISIANQLIDQLDVSYEQSLIMLLKLGFSLNDAAVSTWADKYEYMVMRPSVYIQAHIDPSYQTNLYRFINWPNPSFPGYPSGHSAFSSAAAGVFINEFGNTINFTDKTHEGRAEFRGASRQYSSLSEMAQENAYSRLPLGVHVRMDCTEGLRLGYEISDAVNAYDLTE